jgi:hypothetical protein
MPPKQSKTTKAVKKVVKAAQLTQRAKAILAPKTLMPKINGKGDYTHPSRFSRVQGRGDYLSDIGNIGKGVSSLFETGKGLFNAITGRGDYRGNAASHQKVYETSGIEGAFTSAFSNPNPLKMGAMGVEFGGGKPTVVHREFVGPVLSSTEFATTTFRIQPGLRGPSVLMPWGSSVAAAFQQYELEGMILEYVSTSTNYSSSTTLGSVMLSTQYNANAVPYGSQREVDNAEFTTTSAPDKSFIHPIECSTKDSPVSVRYVRSNNSAVSSDDERLDDVGVFQVSTFGNPVVGAVIGELWVTYKVRFLKPELADFHAGTTFIGNADVAGAVFEGFVANKNSSLPCIVSGGSVTLPNGYAGNYVLSISCQDVQSAISLNTAGSGITPLLCYNNGANAVFNSGFYPGADAPQMLNYSFNFNGKQSEGELVFIGTKGVGSCTLMILPLDNDISSTLTLVDDLSSQVAAQHAELSLLRKQMQELLSSSSRSLGPRPDSPRPPSPSSRWTAQMRKLHSLAARDDDTPEESDRKDREFQMIHDEQALFSPSSVPARVRNHFTDVAETSLAAAILAKAKANK